MDQLKNKITDILTDTFPGATVELEDRSPGEKVMGFLIWQKFEGLEQIQRQQKTWKALRGRLSREERRHISAILTATPLEMTVVNDEDDF